MSRFTVSKLGGEIFTSTVPLGSCVHVAVVLSEMYGLVLMAWFTDRDTPCGEGLQLAIDLPRHQ